MKNKFKILSLFLVLSYSLVASIFSDDLKKQPSAPDEYASSVLSDLPSREFVISAMRKVYSQFDYTPKSINDIIDILLSNYEKGWKSVSEKLKTYYKNDPDFSLRFSKMYQKYKIESPIKKLEFIKDLIKGPVVADIGCGFGDLSKAIIKNIPSVKKIVATDIKRYSEITNLSIEFKQQLQPDKIPIDSHSVDTVLLVYVLHHVKKCYQESLLKEINRILKKGGKVVILEDTYSNTLQPEYGKKLLKKFLLLDDKHKKDVLAFYDWLTDEIKEIDMPMPCTHKSIEEWERCFKKIGFSVERKQYLGIKADFSLSPSPKGIFVLKKI